MNDKPYGLGWVKKVPWFEIQKVSKFQCIRMKAVVCSSFWVLWKSLCNNDFFRFFLFLNQRLKIEKSEFLSWSQIQFCFAFFVLVFVVILLNSRKTILWTTFTLLFFWSCTRYDMLLKYALHASIVVAHYDIVISFLFLTKNIT